MLNYQYLKLRNNVYNIKEASVCTFHRGEDVYIQITIDSEVTDLWDEIDTITFSLGEGGKKMGPNFLLENITKITIIPNYEDYANTFTVEADEMTESTIIIEKINNDEYHINWEGLCNPRLVEGFTTDVPFVINCIAKRSNING